MQPNSYHFGISLFSPWRIQQIFNGQRRNWNRWWGTRRRSLGLGGWGWGWGWGVWVWAWRSPSSSWRVYGPSGTINMSRLLASRAAETTSEAACTKWHMRRIIETSKEQGRRSGHKLGGWSPRNGDVVSALRKVRSSIRGEQNTETSSSSFWFH